MGKKESGDTAKDNGEVPKGNEEITGGITTPVTETKFKLLERDK